MITDIEDHSDKNKKDYNDIDYSKYDKSVCKNIFKQLLYWIDNNKSLLSVEQNKTLVKMFDRELNKQIRLSKIKDFRKSVILNIFKILNLFDVCTVDEEVDKIFKEFYQKYFDLLKLLLRKKPTRNLSGITSITIVTAPFPNGQSFSCKHNCYFCPNEPAHEGNNWQAQPRSYLYSEPAVLRANEFNFDAYDQMYNRMKTLYTNGHTLDKLDIIIEGGTYTEYPPNFLEVVHQNIFYAANTFFDKEKRDKKTIAEEMEINKTTKVHIIGISIETRPDAIDDIWIRRFRDWGVTRIQIGIQHTDNTILKKINRGHTIECALECMRYLKDNCFKIHIHIMPDLPGSTPEMDKKMFDFIYSHVFPDEMKIYPCQVVPWTIIEKWNKGGKYTPYSDSNINDLIDVIKYAMLTCPEYVRFPRVVRDIPASYISAGNHYSNLRQMIDNQLEKENLFSKDIRTREIGRNKEYYNQEASYNTYYCYANEGHEYFIAYESHDKKALFGFIRLRITEVNNLSIFRVLNNKGLIRELHVYGDTIEVGIFDNRGCQHKGIGKGLLKIAEKISMKNGCYGTAVISGEGVKGYYEKIGYREEDTFMIKEFWIIQVLYYKLIKYYKLLSIIFCILMSFVIKNTFI